MKNEKNIFINRLLYFIFILAWGIGDILNNVNDDFKYVFFALNLVWMLITINKNRKKRGKYELNQVLFFIFVIEIISIIFQIINYYFFVMNLKEIFYMLLPIIYCYLLFNYEGNFKIDYYFKIAAIIFSIVFLIRSYKVMSLNNILSISFLESYSPFEFIGNADIFFVLFLYFYSQKNKKYAVLSFIFCFFSFKRLHVVFSILYIIYNKLSYLLKLKSPNLKVVNLCKIFFILSPLVLTFVFSNEFSSFFYKKFGIDFNAFVQGRFYVVNYVIDKGFPNYGIGSISKYLIESSKRVDFLAEDLHCDILRIYLETTIIGLLALVNRFFNLGKKSLDSFFVIIFVFLVLFSSHILNTFIFWIYAYLYIMFSNYNADEEKVNE